MKAFVAFFGIWLMYVANVQSNNSSCICPPVYPTFAPTKAPIAPTTKAPTDPPVTGPTKNPTRSPTNNPTKNPTNNPTRNPTRSPTNNPTKYPTRSPTKSPTRSPTNNPTKFPTKPPVKTPTATPTTKSPTKNPTRNPTQTTKSPTRSPTRSPTEYPTKAPTTKSPTKRPGCFGLCSTGTVCVQDRCLPQDSFLKGVKLNQPCVIWQYVFCEKATYCANETFFGSPSGLCRKTPAISTFISVGYVTAAVRFRGVSRFRRGIDKNRFKFVLQNLLVGESRTIVYIENLAVEFNDPYLKVRMNIETSNLRRVADGLERIIGMSSLNKTSLLLTALKDVYYVVFLPQSTVELVEPVSVVSFNLTKIQPIGVEKKGQLYWDPNVIYSTLCLLIFSMVFYFMLETCEKCHKCCPCCYGHRN